MRLHDLQFKHISALLSVVSQFNSKQQDPAVLYCDAYFTTSWQERSANMLPDSLCSSCNNGYTSLDLHTLTQLCIGLLRYSESYDFTLCPRQNTEHSNCDIDREKLRTISHRNPRLHVAGCGRTTWWRNRKRNFSNPLCILTSLWKERTITINSFCCCCCCFIFKKNSSPMYMWRKET